MAEFLLYGTVVGSDQERESEYDVAPVDFRKFMETVEDGEDVVVEINSPGGNVTDGITIAQMIRQASSDGHRTVARVRGLAASIASVIMCACDEVQLSRGSLVMVHECWGVVQGNKTQLEKEIEVMRKMDDVILSFYRDKFTISDDEIRQMMLDETWFSTEDADSYGFRCTVLDEEPMKLAARAVDFCRRFNKQDYIERLLMKDTTKEDEVMKEPETVEETPVADKSEETPEEENPEKIIEELRKQVEDLERQLAECRREKEDGRCDEDDDEEEKDMVSREEADRRVAGMQSAMAKQINDFKNQLSTREKDLTEFKDKVTSLQNALDESKRELFEKTQECASLASALKDRTDALDTLNSAVNSASDVLPTLREGLARCITPAEKVAFIASGKYIR